MMDFTIKIMEWCLSQGEYMIIPMVVLFLFAVFFICAGGFALVLFAVQDWWEVRKRRRHTYKVWSTGRHIR